MFRPFPWELRQEWERPPHVVAPNRDISPVGSVWTGSFGMGGWRRRLPAQRAIHSYSLSDRLWILLRSTRWARRFSFNRHHCHR